MTLGRGAEGKRRKWILIWTYSICWILPAGKEGWQHFWMGKWSKPRPTKTELPEHLGNPYFTDKSTVADRWSGISVKSLHAMQWNWGLVLWKLEGNRCSGMFQTNHFFDDRKEEKIMTKEKTIEMAIQTIIVWVFWP